MKEQLKSMLNNLINDKLEEADLDFHAYITAKMKVVTGIVEENKNKNKFSIYWKNGDFAAGPFDTRKEAETEHARLLANAKQEEDPDEAVENVESMTIGSAVKESFDELDEAWKKEDPKGNAKTNRDRAGVRVSTPDGEGKIKFEMKSPTFSRMVPYSDPIVYVALDSGKTQSYHRYEIKVIKEK